MELLTSVFSRLLTMGLTALPVMAVVLLVRAVLGRTSRRCCYALWAVVAFRLVCPVTLSQAFSIFNLAPLQPVAEAATGLIGDTGFSAIQPVSVIPDALTGTAAAFSAGTAIQDTVKTAPTVAAMVWLLVLGALLGWGAVSYLRLRERVAAAVRLEGNVWACDGIPTPFVMGLWRPRIYLPFRLADEERAYVLAHERTHIRRGDPWTKMLALVILAVYWWHPGVWLCWVLFCRDMEMRCDEAVLRELGDGVKTGYSRSLASFALTRRTPMVVAFGEHDAVRRVKHVLNWKQAGPGTVFLAVSAVILVTMVCGTNGQAGPSWVKLTGAGSGVEVTWNLKEPIQSWAIYEDVYENGVLRSSEARILDGFREDGDGAAPRRFRFTLEALTVNSQDGGFGGELNCRYDETTLFTVSLPKDHYTGSGFVPGDGQSPTIRKKTTLTAGEETVLGSYLFSTEPTGAVTGYHRDLGVVGTNDTVVQFRLVVSAGGVDAFLDASQSAAGTLFDLRTPHLGDAPAVENLLSALGVGDLGAYSIERFTAAQPYILQVNFKEAPGDIDPTSPITDAAMTVNAAALLALIEDLEQVNWSYPSREDGYEVLITQYLDRTQPDAWAQSLGYADCKDLGRTAPGVQALLAYLGWDGGTESAADRLFANRYDTSALAEELLCRGPWGQPELEKGDWLTVEAAGAWLYFEFIEPPAFPVDFDTAMARNALVLLDLRQELDDIRWSYPTAGGTAEREFDRAADMTAILALSSGTEIPGQRPSQPAEDLQRLMDDAGRIDAKLFRSLAENVRSQGGTVSTEPFSDILGCDGVLVTETTSYGWSIRTYYALAADGGRTPIAESFGGGEPGDHAVDLDGDGQKELVCNVTYGGDGARRVDVYQRRSDGVYRGRLEYREELPADYRDWGANSTWEEYDPSAKVFRVHYDAGAEGAEYAVWETRGLEHVAFERYAPS